MKLHELLRCKVFSLILAKQCIYNIGKTIMKKEKGGCNISNIVRRIVAVNKANKHSHNFEVNPLDVNIAKMQYNLIEEYCDGEQKDSNFDVIKRDFVCKDTTLNISHIAFILRLDYNSQKMILDVRISNKKGHTQNLSVGKR